MPAVYTRTGDRGDTGLYGGSRVAKQSARVEAYGAVDEGNAVLGWAKAGLPEGSWRERVHAIQQRLFVVGAELASDAAGAARLTDLICEPDVVELERLIDDCLEVSGKPRAFVVPGRDARSAAFHCARTVIRRAERRVLTLAELEPVRSEVITYLNRLSDATYGLARLSETWADAARLESIVRDVVGRHIAREVGRGAAAQRFDLDVATRLAALAEARAREIGVPIVFAAVDASGNLICLHRMADSLLASIDLAADKAWTAVAFRLPTQRLGELADGPLPGVGETNRGRVVRFGGGIPLFESGGGILGGIGVSGGTVEQDIDIAERAMVILTGERP